MSTGSVANGIAFEAPFAVLQARRFAEAYLAALELLDSNNEGSHETALEAARFATGK